MPLSKEIADLLPLVAEMDDRHQKDAAKWLRRVIVADDYCKGMTRKEALTLMLLDLQKIQGRRK